MTPCLRISYACSALAVTASLAGHAVAAAGGDDVWSRPVAAMAQVGFGTPTGYYGLALEYAPVPLLVAWAGAGMGSGPYCLAPEEQPKAYDAICARWSRDLQLAGGGRLRVLRSESTALTFGAGLSEGGYTWVEFTTDAPAYKSSERAWWANLDASFEYRAPSGLSVRGHLGYALMLNPGDLQCVSWGAGNSSHSHCVEDHQGDGQRLVYFGLGAGWAF